MPVNTPHVEYEARASTWQMIRDAIEGERAVKARAAEYLPIPPGMPSSFGGEVLENGNRVGSDPYSFYLGFADFPEIVEPALAGFQGVVHAKPPTIVLPKSFEYLKECACIDGSTLETIWSLITREILSVGRIGLLIDVDPVDQKLRYVPYSIENVLNWEPRPARSGGGANFLVLREPQQRVDDKDPFKVVNVIRYRELRINGGVYQSRVWEEKRDDNGNVIFAVDGGHAEQIEGWTTIIISGKTLNFIPFLCLNSMDVGYDYEAIPLLPLVRRAYSIYRKSADYNRALYIKGDPQICVSGITKEEAPEKVGGDGIWTFPSPDAKAWYLDIDGQGIPLMRQSIKDEYDRFDMEGGKLLATDKTSPESGAALRRRQMAQQVTLKNVIMFVGSAFEQFLKQIVLTSGGEPETVVFSPDTDFAEPTMTSQELLETVSAKNSGAPMSYETMHELMRRGGITELTFEAEMESIKKDAEFAKIIKPPAPAPSPSLGGGGKDALLAGDKKSGNDPNQQK